MTDDTQAVRTGQEATSTLLQAWGDAVQTVLGTPTDPGQVSSGRVIDAWFDVADEVLAVQRQFTKAVLALGNPVEAMTRVVRQGAETVRQAADDAGGTNGAPEREAGRAVPPSSALARVDA